MNTTINNLETEILSSVHQMNSDQKRQVLTYVDKLKVTAHASQEKYRREAMRQIREALATL